MTTEPDPVIQGILGQLGETRTPPNYAVLPSVAREQFRALMDSDDPEPVGEVHNTTIPGPESPIPLRLYYPELDEPAPVIVFFHGGGWVIGDLDTHDNVCRALTNAANAVVISVDYRLAPEHPFPAALDDAYAATQWAATHAETLGGDPANLIVAGDSAGGNLAASVSHRARDWDGPEIAHQVLIYPAVNIPDIRHFDSYRENGTGYLLEFTTMEWFYDQYLPDPVDRGNIYAAPLMATDFTDLPPATVITAGFDPLHDEGTAYANQLTEAGVNVAHHNYPGMIHLFINFLGLIDQAESAIEEIAERVTMSVD